MHTEERWQHSAFRWADRIGGLDAKALFTHPGPLKKYDSKSARKRICVIGGGVAGLSAAYELANLGHGVTVFESSDRWGGRILTHRFGDTTYGEFGAMRIPRGHGCVDHYVEEFNLERRPFVACNNNAFYFLRGAKCRIRDWPEIAGCYMPVDSMYHRSPGDLLNQMLSSFPPFSDKAAWEQFSNEITGDELRRVEELSLFQAMTTSLLPTGPRLPEEIWRYLGRTTHHFWLEQWSMLHWLREARALDDGGKYEIVGGMFGLVQGFLDGLEKCNPRPILLSGTRVVEVRIVSEGVRVSSLRCEAAPSPVQKETFDYVICTAPADGTAQIEFYPKLDPKKFEALTSISYIAAGKTLMHCKKRHWEFIDGIYGGSSITDLPNQQCWYPSDNSEPWSDDDSDHLTSSLEVFPGTNIDDASTHPTDWNPKDKNLSQSPGVFLAAYVWGGNARRFASMSDNERTELMVRGIEGLHPRNKEYLDDIVHWSWDAQRSPGGGAFAYFAPGDQSRYQEALCKPVVDEKGRPRVCFAGEHLGVIQGWIQSAIQTGLTAAITVLQGEQ